ncbi:hypothetical protein ABBQ32_011169 [Trebouxia sp. C0010 RCD-2024]
MSGGEELLSTISDSMDSDPGFDQEFSEEEDDIPIIGTGCAPGIIGAHNCRAFA